MKTGIKILIGVGALMLVGGVVLAIVKNKAAKALTTNGNSVSNSDAGVAAGVMLAALVNNFGSHADIQGSAAQLKTAYDTAVSNNDQAEVNVIVPQIAQLLHQAIKSVYAGNYLTHGWQDASGNYVDRDLDILYKGLSTGAGNMTKLASGIAEISDPAYYGNGAGIPGTKRFNSGFKISNYLS